MKFKFAFEKLLDHKHTVEDIARRDYLQAQAAVDEAMNRINIMYKQIEEARKRGGHLADSGGRTAAELSQIDEFIKGQNVRIERERMQLRELMAEAERRQEILIEAAKERKTLEKLKERRLEDFKMKRKRHELKENDEIVVTRFKRSAEG